MVIKLLCFYPCSNIWLQFAIVFIVLSLTLIIVRILRWLSNSCLFTLVRIAARILQKSSNASLVPSLVLIAVRTLVFKLLSFLYAFVDWISNPQRKTRGKWISIISFPGVPGGITDYHPNLSQLLSQPHQQPISALAPRPLKPIPVTNTKIGKNLISSKPDFLPLTLKTSYYRSC